MFTLRRLPRRHLATALVLGLAWSQPLAAQTGQIDGAKGQPPVTLIADSVHIEQQNLLVAEGSVEVFSQGRHLTASKVTYDKATGRLQIEGPIRLTDANGTVVLASAADLSSDMTQGLVEGARMLFDEQLQVAAAEMHRSGENGRFTDLRRAVATSCEVCHPGDKPWWQIRARRVIDDHDTQRIYFEDAQFRVLDVPVAWLPGLSVPEPGVDRARGFLTPTTRSSSLLGTGVLIPYFVPIGPSADLTFTPYVTANQGGDYTRTLILRYRQAFDKGSVTATGAISRDSTDPSETRAYIFANGSYALPDDVVLSFQLREASDKAYLSDYDFSDDDRLESNVALTRVRDETREQIKISHFQSLRTDEDADTVPDWVGSLNFNRRWASPDGGWLDFIVEGEGHERPSDTDITGTDMATARTTLRYSRQETVGNGLRVGADARLLGTVKGIWQNSEYERYQSAMTPELALEASLPMQHTSDNGVRHILEPIVQLVHVGKYTIKSPNDDSTQPTLDSGNLFGLNRFPGLDRVEQGNWANVALAWQRYGSAGNVMGLTLGRVVRTKSDTAFSDGTGLAGANSDWLLQTDLDLSQKIILRNLLLVGDDGNATLNETRLGWLGGRVNLTTIYTWQVADPDLSLDSNMSELTLDGSYKINSSWATTFQVRHDFVADSTVRSAIGISYSNECVRVDLSALRRFRNTDEEEATTSYGLTVSLARFGTSGTGSTPPGRCSG